MIAVITSSTCWYNKPATNFTGKTIITCMGAIISFFNCFRLFSLFTKFVPPKSFDDYPFGRLRIPRHTIFSLLNLDRICKHGGSLRGPPIILLRAKQNGGLDLSKPPVKAGGKTAVRRLFFFCRRPAEWKIFGLFGFSVQPFQDKQCQSCTNQKNYDTN